MYPPTHCQFVNGSYSWKIWFVGVYTEWFIEELFVPVLIVCKKICKYARVVLYYGKQHEGRLIMLKKAYVEITNACNLSCSFCHGTKRPIRYLTTEEFRHICRKLQGRVEYLFFHVMGEPLLHPRLEEFLSIAGESGFQVILTTNGTLLAQKADILCSAGNIRKISISLHSYEANTAGYTLEEYLTECFAFCRRASEKGIICVMRLWNQGGAENMNPQILEKMHAFFDAEPGMEWKETYSGYKIKDKIFLEWGEYFEWPDTEGEYKGNTHTCYALRDQIGILSDGTAVPCCLDAEGSIPLGNIFDMTLDEILANPRAVMMKKALENRRITEPLCQRCGYAYIKKY
ncbi:MAG: radical SAM protein [Ruminococcaceae bacterium]|nr:radical SAM protein [Oscillospiraceae bacterium]